MDMIAASVVEVWLQWVWPIAMFLIGLGLVVFVHELGHFLAAKAVGIKVNRFALGMGPRLVGFKRGETDYCLCVLPIGGYVAMEGQEDFKPEAGQNPDPRAFNNKSVRARFFVVAAGVVMNVLCAAVLFILVSLAGIRFPAAVVGGVRAGFPAATARIAWQDGAAASQPANSASAPTDEAALWAPHLQPGDRILRIHGPSSVLNLVGDRVLAFNDMLMIATLAGQNDRFAFTVERTVDGQRRVGTVEMGVKGIAGEGRLGFGIVSAASTVLTKADDYRDGQAFRDGDRLLAVNGLNVAHAWDVERIQRSLTGLPATVTVERAGKRVDVPVRPELGFSSESVILWLKDGTAIRGRRLEEADGAVEVISSEAGTRKVQEADIAGGVTKSALDILGLLPRLRVQAVENGSPAARAGLMPGDVVAAYGDRTAPTRAEFRKISQELKGKETAMTVLRDGKDLPLTVAPSASGEMGVLMGTEQDHLVVAGIREGSPAAKAQIPAGAEVAAVNATPVANWPELYQALRDLEGKTVSLSWRLAGQEGQADLGELTDSMFEPGDYGFQLLSPPVFPQPLTVRIMEPNPLKAVAWGCRETVKMVLTSYLSLHSLMQGTVSAKSISGPVGIGEMAVRVARKSMTDFVYFMAFLSVAVAVFNFLPLPVMDGGLAVFLLIEKLRGKPAPPKVMVAAQIFGWVLILGIFIAVTWNDILKIVHR